jgi:hypothetical protein
VPRSTGFPSCMHRRARSGRSKGQEVIGGCAIGSPASLKRNSISIDVHDGTTRRPTTCRGVGLIVAGVKVAVSFSIFRGIAVETADDTRQNTQLLASVVTDDSNLDTN